MFKNDKERDAYWNKEAQQLLVGKRVKSVSWMTAKEAEEHGVEQASSGNRV